MATRSGHTRAMLKDEDPDLHALITLGLVEPVVLNGRVEYRLSSALSCPDYTPNAALLERIQMSRKKRRGDARGTHPSGDR
jgi:hypothetical protein